MPHCHGKRCCFYDNNDDESTSNSSLSDYDDDDSNESHSDDNANMKRTHKKRKKKKIHHHRDATLVHEARQLLKEIKHDEKKTRNLEVERRKKLLTGGATGAAMRGIANKPPKRIIPQERTKQPPRIRLCQSSWFTHGSTKTIELLPPNDMMREATKPKQTTSGVKLESTGTLRTKTNITDVSMQGRRSFTFKYEGTFHNPRLYEAKVKFPIKLINASMVVTIGGQGYQQYRVRNADDDGWVDSPYGPITVPNRLPEFVFEKAMIEVLGSTKIEPGMQTHQITKLVDFHTKMKPEEADFKYCNLGGYSEEYDSKTSDQKYGVPI